MYSYFIGTVTEIFGDKVTLEIANVGYEVIIGNPYAYKIGHEYRIYLYQVVRDDAISLYGFENNETKLFFLKILSVKGIGPKNALNIINSFHLDELIRAIDTEDLEFLKRIPGVGSKSAQQIILDLKGKLVSIDNREVSINSELDNALSALKNLGYTHQELSKVKRELQCQKLEADEYVKLGLKILVNL